MPEIGPIRRTSGIAPLDKLLGGSIPPGSSVVFVSEPAVDSGVFVFQMLAQNLPLGRVLLLLTRTTEGAFRLAMKEYGFEAPPMDVIDCYSAIINEGSRSKYAVDDPRDFNEVRSAVFKAVDSNDRCLFLFDDLNVLVEYFGEARALELVKGLIAKLREMGGVGAFVYTNWKRDGALKGSLRPLFDYVVSLNALEKKVVFGQCFSVEKADGLMVSPFAVPFKVVRPGGVHVFVPKLLVTGPYNAGKSSFLHSASTTAVSVDRLGTTIALDHGHVDYKGFSIDLFGTPGQERFDPILNLLGGEAIGVVLVVDSTAAGSFPRAIEMLEKTNTLSIPCVVVANKADLPGAVPVGEVRRILRVDDSVPIFPVHAENIEDAKKRVGKVPCPLRKGDVDSVIDALIDLIFFKK